MAAPGREIAASLDVPARLLHIVPELFADLRSLGSSPRRVVHWLRGVGLERSCEVVDLGCGKGAVSVEVAAQLGCRVVGVDAFAPLVEAAEQAAAKRGVAKHCRFMVSDYRETRRWRKRFDAGLMLSVAPVEVAAGVLHRLVRPGGVYIIDDAVWVDPGSEPPAGMLTIAGAEQLFADLGDVLIRSHRSQPHEIRRMEERMYRLISARAREISRARPPLRGPLKALLAQQRRAIGDLLGPLRPMMWMVQRR